MEESRSYELRVVVQLHEPIRDADGENPLTQYFQIFGVRAESLRSACELVEAAITDGQVIEFRGAEKRLEEMSPEMQKGYDEASPAVWFRSGRAFLAEE